MHQTLDQTEFVHMTWAAQPSQLRSVRRSLHRWLAPLLRPDRANEVILAAGEAAANSVEHAYANGDAGNVDVTFWTESDAIWIEICDHGRWQPPSKPIQRGRGLGIPLMQRMMDCVLIDFDARGTRVLLRHPVGNPAPDQLPIPRQRSAVATN